VREFVGDKVRSKGRGCVTAWESDSWLDQAGSIYAPEALFLHDKSGTENLKFVCDCFVLDVVVDMSAAVIQFAQFVVTSQTFYTSNLCAALVNLKPIVPGHSLVIPLRVVPRYVDLSPEEVGPFSRMHSHR
jgi:HIT domain